MKKISMPGEMARCARLLRRLRARTTAPRWRIRIVVVPFLAIRFAILETASCSREQVLQTAASDAARLVMTGQAQAQSLNSTTFKNYVCSRIFGLFNCQGGLKIDVRTYTAFTSANTSKPIDANGNLNTSSFGFQPGVAGDIVVVLPGL